MVLSSPEVFSLVGKRLSVCLSRMSQVPTELASRTMAVKGTSPVRMSCKRRGWESGVEEEWEKA